MSRFIVIVREATVYIMIEKQLIIVTSVEPVRIVPDGIVFLASDGNRHEFGEDLYLHYMPPSTNCMVWRKKQ